MKFNFIAAASVLFVMASCGNSKEQAAENANPTDSIEAIEAAAEAAPEQVAAADEIDEIGDEAGENYGDAMFDAANAVFAMVFPDNSAANEKAAKSCCTSSFIKALQRENDFDDGGIAWWALRTMEQEGPENASRIISMEPKDAKSIAVEYSDMGHKGTTVLYFVEDGGKYKVNSAVVTYNNTKRSIK